MPPLSERNSAPATFQIFSQELVAEEVGGRKVIHTTASSAVELLNGDEITEQCVMDMVTQAKNAGMTIFLNHKYDIPEDVFGSTTAAALVMRNNELGLPIADMDLEIALDETNPRAVQTFNSIQNGTKIGVSIGANIVDWEFRDPKARFDGGVRFKKMKLLEASMVGIPKNPRSWVQNAVVALHSVGSPELILDEDALDVQLDAAGVDVLPDSAFSLIDVDGRHNPHHHKDGSIWMGLLRKSLADEDSKGRGHLVRHAAEYGLAVAEPTETEAAVEATAEAEATVEEAPESTATPESSETPTDDLPEASVTGDEPTETNETAPTETEGLSEVLNAASSLVLDTRDRVVVELVLSTLERTAEELTETRSQVTSLEATNRSLIEERDEARRNLTEATAIVEVLARLPLGRKASFAAPIENFQTRFSGIYDDKFLKLIDERSKDD